MFEPRTLATRLPEPVRLRPLRAADGEAFAAHVRRDLERLSEHLAWPANTTTAEEAAVWLGRYERGEDGRVGGYGAWRGENELLGGAMLLHHDPVNLNVELGVWVAGAAEGTGLASGLCRILLGVARHELGAERVEWACAPENVRSRRLAERLGFVHEGTLRANYVAGDRRLDADILGLVGEEIDAALGEGPAAP